MKTQYKEDGINGLGEGVVNVNSEEFKGLQEIIKLRSAELSNEEKEENALFSIKLDMYAYLENQNDELIEAGRFLNDLIKALKIKKKFFADYIQTRESNLSALFSGNRRINADLAIKLGKIFGLNPVVWINIQTKNDIDKMKKKNEKDYLNYSLDDLLRKRSGVVI